MLTALNLGRRCAASSLSKVNRLPRARVCAASAFEVTRSCSFVSDLYNKKLVASVTAPTLQSALKEPLPDICTGRLVLQRTFVDNIKTCLQPDNYGVFVVWAPPDSCKTSYMHHAATEWLNEPPTINASSHRHVRFITTYHGLKAPEDLLRNHLFVSSCEELTARLADLDYEVILVLDQFDDAFTSNMEQRDALKRFVRGLAAVSKNSRYFRVVLGLTNPGLAKTVLCWNQGKKIHLCGGFDANNVLKFKWGEAETKQFVEPDWSDDDKRRFTHAACKSGNVETMAQLKHDRSLLHDATFQQVVEADGKAWETGIALIHSRLAHPTPE